MSERVCLHVCLVRSVALQWSRHAPNRWTQLCLQPVLLRDDITLFRSRSSEACVMTQSTSPIDWLQTSWCWKACKSERGSSRCSFCAAVHDLELFCYLEFSPSEMFWHDDDATCISSIGRQSCLLLKEQSTKRLWLPGRNVEMLFARVPCVPECRVRRHGRLANVSTGGWHRWRWHSQRRGRGSGNDKDAYDRWCLA